MKTELSEIAINGVPYIPKSMAKIPDIEGNLKIVILQRGWVMVGYLDRDGSECKLRRASVIRNWGTTKGLGEIAMGGPTSSTKIDKCGLVEFDYLTVVAAISCAEDKWQAAL